MNSQFGVSISSDKRIFDKKIIRVENPLAFRYEEIPLRLKEEMSVNGLISTIWGEFIYRTHNLSTERN